MLPRNRKAVLLTGLLVAALAAVFPPWWYEWRPNDPVGLNLYDVDFHPLWYRSAYGGEIVGFLYVSQLVAGLIVFAACLTLARVRREATARREM